METQGTQNSQSRKQENKLGGRINISQFQDLIQNSRIKARDQLTEKWNRPIIAHIDEQLVKFQRRFTTDSCFGKPAWQFCKIVSIVL